MFYELSIHKICTFGTLHAGTIGTLSSHLNDALKCASGSNVLAAGKTAKGIEMVHQHYGTMPMIRQCVAPGMMALHEGRTYRVSAVINERQWTYLHAGVEVLRISDCVIEVLLDGRGYPLIH